VVLTGYSQGGLVAATIAASGQYNVSNLVTFGAPAGLVEIPPDIPVLNVRHSDDIVPALGGYDRSSHALVVERELFAGVPVPYEEVFPAHQLGNYRATAALIDDAQSPQVRSALAALDAFAPRDDSTTVVTSTFHATRVTDGEGK
jgi:pimeloyl-ACP methyl ester carboxylesterase